MKLLLSVKRIPKNNLLYVDSCMDKVLDAVSVADSDAATLTFDELLDRMQTVNPLGISHMDVYAFMLKRLVRSFALGDLYSESWNGELDYGKMAELYNADGNAPFEPVNTVSLDYWLMKSAVIRV